MRAETFFFGFSCCWAEIKEVLDVLQGFILKFDHTRRGEMNMHEWKETRRKEGAMPPPPQDNILCIFISEQAAMVYFHRCFRLIIS